MSDQKSLNLIINLAETWKPVRVSVNINPASTTSLNGREIFMAYKEYPNGDWMTVVNLDGTWKGVPAQHLNLTRGAFGLSPVESVASKPKDAHTLHVMGASQTLRQSGSSITTKRILEAIPAIGIDVKKAEQLIAAYLANFPKLQAEERVDTPYENPVTICDSSEARLALYDLGMKLYKTVNFVNFDPKYLTKGNREYLSNTRRKYKAYHFGNLYSNTFNPSDEELKEAKELMKIAVMRADAAVTFIKENKSENK